jgi:septal ring factor EnvC (AmiA/AmiB activator)
MDETKQTDGLPSANAEKAPAGSEGTTPKPEVKTYSQEEFDKAIQADRVARGRDAKKLSDWEASLKAQQAEIEASRTEITKIQEQIDEAELEAAKGDPARLRELQARKSYKALLADLETKKRELQKERDALERDKTEHAETLKAAQEAQLEIDIWEIGAEFNVNPVTLKDTMKDLNLSTADQARALAKRLSESLKRPDESEKGLTPDSGVTSGTGKPTMEQLGKMSMEDYAAYRKKGNP